MISPEVVSQEVVVRQEVVGDVYLTTNGGV
jgi:hypothetical protein